MKISDGREYYGIRFYDNSKTILKSIVLEDKDERIREWSKLQEIPEGYKIVGI